MHFFVLAAIFTIAIFSGSSRKTKTIIKTTTRAAINPSVSYDFSDLYRVLDLINNSHYPVKGKNIDPCYSEGLPSDMPVNT